MISVVDASVAVRLLVAEEGSDATHARHFHGIAHPCPAVGTPLEAANGGGAASSREQASSSLQIVN